MVRKHGSAAAESPESKPLISTTCPDDMPSSYGATSLLHTHCINGDPSASTEIIVNEINDGTDGQMSCIWRNRSERLHVEPGDMNLLSSKFESLDYEICENTLMQIEEQTNGYKFVERKNWMRWTVIFFVGVLTALVACCIDIAVEMLSSVKFYILKYVLDENTKANFLIAPVALWYALNAIPTAISAIMVAYGEPAAAGSGIPLVKCYLNGVKVPNVVRIKTLFVKAVGVALSVLGGIAVGKEGPMIHSGAVIAAGISQGKSTTFHKDLKIFKYFREDHEKRDFVSGGAAAGVAAAFGAPIGGVLFSLEEGASFWNQKLTWRIFLCSMVSAFTLNIVLSSYHGRPGELAFSGLLNFGKFDDVYYNFIEIPVFLIMGAMGGILGALFNMLNHKLTVFRMRHMTSRWVKVLEAVVVAIITAHVGFGMIMLIDDCRPLGRDPTKYPVQMYCGDGEYNAVAALWFQTPEASVRSLFHNPPGSHQWFSLLIFCVFYFFLACWTYGLSISSGLFIPTLLIGAAWGRLVGNLLQWFYPNTIWIHPGKYSLIGAAAQLGGIVRMTISLTVILMEATGNLSLGLPLMFVLIVAKYVGDYFNEGLYDIHIQLSRVPILPWEPPPKSSNVYASEVMSHPVQTLRTVESVGRIVDVLRTETFNGFPVVDPVDHNDGDLRTFGRFRGLILRSQLLVLLQHKMFVQTSEFWQPKQPNIEMFRSAYPRYPTIHQVHISDTEMSFTVDLRPVMNFSPYSVIHTASLPRIFRLFRALGLRHLVVINDRNEVVGMVTRKDLARYRVQKHRGELGMQELLISDR